MKSKIIIKLTFSLFVISLLIIAGSMRNQQTQSISPSEAESIAVDAYIYGYPLVTMDMTRQVMTNVEIPNEMKAPMGQFINARVYPNSSFKDVTAPNADTLYSVAWLDLLKEPYILHLPDEKGRYYLMPILSSWTEVFAVPGKRTTGTNAADYVITGPFWKGLIPPGLKEIKTPTNVVWILGRTYCTGTPEDYKEVHTIQDQYSLKPLSFFGKPYAPSKAIVNPNIDMTTPVREQVNQLDINAYFNKLAKLMKNNPPASEDEKIIANMAKLGIIPGQKFDLSSLDSTIAEALKKVPKLGFEKIMDHQRNAEKIINGWVISFKTGKYGTDYLDRALVAAIGLGANLPEDAVYPYTNVDSNGAKLDGSNEYVLHFSKNQIPPVKGFWSLTMYNDQYFFIDNLLNRYTLSPRDQLNYNQDGSLDLYIQNSPPKKENEPNWLPAPEGDFILMLRLYWPEKSILDGQWVPPAVKKNN